MEKNLLALEVKPAILSLQGVLKDLETVAACMAQANYEYGLLLIYGGSRAWRRCLRIARDRAAASFHNLKVYWHERAGVSAIEVP